MVQILLSTFDDPSLYEWARDDAIYFAGKGNQRELLDLYLEPAYTS